MRKERIHLQIIWDKRLQLLAKGNNLIAAGNKCEAEGHKLRLEGSRLCAKSEKLYSACEQLRNKGYQLYDRSNGTKNEGGGYKMSPRSILDSFLDFLDRFPVDLILRKTDTILPEEKEKFSFSQATIVDVKTQKEYLITIQELNPKKDWFNLAKTITKRLLTYDEVMQQFNKPEGKKTGEDINGRTNESTT